MTQQLARTLFLTHERKLLRKIRESAIAFALERRFPKDRLLEAYLNHIYLGQDGGAAIHGVGRAAQHFFGKDVSELTLDESATLAGIIRGPSVYSPHRHPERARQRRDLVLRLMREEGLIDEERHAAARAAELVVQPPRAAGAENRWYLDYLRRELGRTPGAEDPGAAGLTIVSTIEPGMQRAAEDAVRSGLERLEARRPRLADRDPPLQAALVALDPWTGEILALVGGRSYAETQFNRATRARRQPGSAFKPIVALAALAGDASPPFTLASVLDDEPLRVETPAGAWSPSNSDREFLGPVTLREALEFSRNVPFARLGLEVGPGRIVSTARALGVQSPLAPVPSLALGASEVTLLELTAAYGVLAAEGERIPSRAVRAVLDPRGERVSPEEPDPTRAFTPGEAYLVTSALRGVVEEGTGRAVRSEGYFGPVAAKSGTTNGSRDAWFVGYTPEIALGVWVGFDDGTPVGLTGSQAALPIFADFLRTVLGPDGGRAFRFPEGVEWVGLPSREGRRGWQCSGEEELFIVGTAPASPCDRWNRGWRRLRRGVTQPAGEAEAWLRSELRELRRRLSEASEGRRDGPAGR